MQYLLLIYDEQENHDNMSESEHQAYLGEFFALNKALKEAGAFVAGDALQSTATATSVRLRKGERMITDGPFAETKEQLGGYYLIDVADLDEALEWAAKIPTARFGTIEVRPIMDYTAG